MFCNSRSFCLPLPSCRSLYQMFFSYFFFIIFINFVFSFSLSSPSFVLICYKVFSFTLFAFVFYCSPSHHFLPYVFSVRYLYFHTPVLILWSYFLFFSFYSFFFTVPTIKLLLCPTKDTLLGFPPSGL